MSHPIGVSPARETPFHKKKKVVGWGLKSVAVVALAIVLAACPDDDDAPLISSTDDEEVSGNEGAPDGTSTDDEAPTDSAGQETNAETGNEETDTSSESADDDPLDETGPMGDLEILDIDGFARDNGFRVVVRFNEEIFGPFIYRVSVELRVDNAEADITTLYSRTDGEIAVDTINRESGNVFPLSTTISTSADTFAIDGTYPPEWPVDPDNDTFSMKIEYQPDPAENVYSVDSGEHTFREDP